MSGVDNMNYMYSISGNNGVMRMGVNFDVKTDPNIDQVLAQLRENQAEPQLPQDVRNYGVKLLKSPTSPMLLIGLSSPHGTHDATFLANYAYINLVDRITQLKGISNVNIFGAGQYAMRFWVKPDQLAKLNLTVNDILTALNAAVEAAQGSGFQVQRLQFNLFAGQSAGGVDVGGSPVHTEANGQPDGDEKQKDNSGNVPRERGGQALTPRYG